MDAAGHLDLDAQAVGAGFLCRGHREAQDDPVQGQDQADPTATPGAC